MQQKQFILTEKIYNFFDHFVVCKFLRCCVTNRSTLYMCARQTYLQHAVDVDVDIKKSIFQIPKL